MKSEFHVEPDAESACRAAADRFASFARESIAARGTFTVALGGGNTPKRMHELLASEHARDVPWNRIEFFLGDERWVPLGSPESNARGVREHLLARVPVDAARVHFVPVDRATPQIAAAEYERELRRIVGDAGLDLVLLGLGRDGHTASLFPNDPTLDERERWVVAVRAPAIYPTRDRITLTPAAIERSRAVNFLVTGKDKSAAVALARAVTAANAEASLDLPSARIRPREAVIWFLDAEAASAS